MCVPTAACREELMAWCEAKSQSLLSGWLAQSATGMLEDKLLESRVSMCGGVARGYRVQYKQKSWTSVAGSGKAESGDKDNALRH